MVDVVASLGEALEGVFGFLEAAGADKEPGGFGAEVGADEEGDGLVMSCQFQTFQLPIGWEVRLTQIH